MSPELEPQVGKTHNLRSAKRLDDGTFTTANWAGSVVPGKWTGAIGFWAVPTATEPLEPQGTEGGWNLRPGSDFTASAARTTCSRRVYSRRSTPTATRSTWPGTRVRAEQSDLPAYIFQTNIMNFVAVPGQTVYCSVQYVSNGTAGQVFFANESTGQHFPITLAPPPGATFSGSSAEWIMEAPGSGEPTSSLPMFTPVVFTSAVCCGLNGTLDNPSDGDIFNIVGDGTTLTQVTLGLDTVTIDYIGPKVAVPEIIGMSAEDGEVALREVGLVGIEQVIPAAVDSNILAKRPRPALWSRCTAKLPLRSKHAR